MRYFFAQLFNHHRQLFWCLIGGDLLILLMHLLFSHQYYFFHLDFEQNLPTFYQSFKLIVFGTLFLCAGLSNSIKWGVKSFILPLSVFLIFLGLDELFQIHENIYLIFEFLDLFHPSKIVESSMKLGYRSSLWILYYLPFIIIFVFWSGYWLRYFQSKMKKNAWILVVSSLSLFTVILAEILSSTGTYDNHTYFWLITTEEVAEMLLSSTLILVGSKILHEHFH